MNGILRWHLLVSSYKEFEINIFNVAAQWNTSQHFLLPSPSSTLPSLPGNDLLANVPLQEVATLLFSGLHPPGNNFGSLFQALSWAALVIQGATTIHFTSYKSCRNSPKNGWNMPTLSLWTIVDWQYGTLQNIQYAEIGIRSKRVWDIPCGF